MFPRHAEIEAGKQKMFLNSGRNLFLLTGKKILFPRKCFHGRTSEETFEGTIFAQGKIGSREPRTLARFLTDKIGFWSRKREMAKHSSTSKSHQTREGMRGEN